MNAALREARLLLAAQDMLRDREVELETHRSLYVCRGVVSREVDAPSLPAVVALNSGLVRLRAAVYACAAELGAKLEVVKAQERANNARLEHLATVLLLGCFGVPVGGIYSRAGQRLAVATACLDWWDDEDLALVLRGNNLRKDGSTGARRSEKLLLPDPTDEAPVSVVEVAVL